MPDADRERPRQVVAEAHQQGRMLRFWGTADTSSVWKVLSEEGVDLIGTDDLGALRSFLASAESK
jgi:glycerophosphoryl diester phosphodiesterase